jgi:hypothetical protein
LNEHNRGVSIGDAGERNEQAGRGGRESGIVRKERRKDLEKSGISIWLRYGKDNRGEARKRLSKKKRVGNYLV